MNDQLLTILKKAKLNFAVLASILVLAIVGKLTNPEFTNSIFLMADQLVSELILLFVAITLGAFIPNFKLVVLGAIAAFIAAAIAIQTGVFTYLTIDYLFAVLIVVLGFASIAIYRRLLDGNAGSGSLGWSHKCCAGGLGRGQRFHTKYAQLNV